MNGLYLVDTLVYSISLLLIVSGQMEKKCFQYIIAFFLLVAVQLFLGENNYFSNFVCSIVLLISFWQKQSLIEYIYQCLYSVTVLLIGIILISSLFLLLFSQTWLTVLFLRILMDIFVIGFGITIKISINYCEKKYPHTRLQRLRVMIQAALLLFYTFGMATIRFGNDIDLALISLLFVALLFLNSMLFNQIQIIRGQQKQKEYIDNIADVYAQSVERDHYFMQLMKSMKTYILKNDMSQLMEYFNEYIEPIAKNSFVNFDCEQINNKLIRNLVKNEINDLSQQKNLLIDCEITGNIDVSYQMVGDIFKVLAEFFSNAKKELCKQKQERNAYIQIYCVENDKILSFKIANSLHDQTMTYDNIKQSEGIGTRMVDRIIKNYPMIEYSSYIRPLPLGRWTLFIQEIIINKEAIYYA